MYLICLCNAVEISQPLLIAMSSSLASTSPISPEGYAIRALSSPLHLEGSVIAGFGRGSKELGCPTANINCVDAITDVPPGIYFGWASLNGARWEQMVMSIGW